MTDRTASSENPAAPAEGDATPAPRVGGSAPSVLQPVDDSARQLARSLLRGARDGMLAVLRPGDGHPAASLVLVATDFEGRPLLLVSALALHSAALDADSRCSLLVSRPGKGDPLAHPRLTVFATASVVAEDDPERPRLRNRFLARHPKAALYADFADFRLIRLEPETASLNGGFARAVSLERTDLVDPPAPELAATVMRARDHMNDDHRDAIDTLAASAGLSEDGWRIATMDRFGFEIIRGDRLARIEFGLDAAAHGYRDAFVSLVRGRTN
ncbi:HugZ family protein [Aurantimonas coralicida]|uniref:HugZ family pyridoxamine 5'-phosphate oxidase n=1 Tax=Aurantimonas coralicida TaxID=182270 RepID=UPI0022A94352|nr:pyridoxamine 5'-phosphate oxidase family protein [Aurantimonas coralicida]